MHRLLVTVAFAASLSAQNDRLTAHPQDVPHVGTGQLTPFGDDGSSCESRAQLLLRAEYLPGPGAVLTGLEFFALWNGNVVYQSLAVTVSPVPPAAVRSGAFAVNLPQPTTVVSLANHTTPWTTNGWQRFPTSQPYVHDGVSDLTIDIQKVAVPSFGNGACTGLFRPDLETMLTAFGPASSGTNLATVAVWQVIPIDVRLVWSNAPTSRLRSPIPASGHHGFAIGSSLDFVLTAAPGSLAALAGDHQWSTPITLPFASGQWWVQGVVLGLAVADANGDAVATLAIPQLPQFVGQQIAYQALVLDPATSSFAFTNANDCFLGQ